MMALTAWVAGAALGVMATSASAQIDGVVRAGLISHAGHADRRPLCPLAGQQSDVLFQTAAGDASAARVGVDDDADGSGVVWFDASVVATRGSYDLWRATVSSSAANRRAYVIEVRDGAATTFLSTVGTSTGQPPVAQWWTLDFTTLTHAPYGATPTSAGTVFRVWAPGASTCEVRGTFSNFGPGPALTRRGEDFIGIAPTAVAGQDYKFYFNNSLWKSDPRASFLNNSGAYNSRIVDQFAYQWQFPNFTPAPRDRWVVYQLHVGTFAGLNDPAGSFTRPARYREVGDRAAHLQELGINAVMLNPINEFPGTQSGGYNPVSMYAWEGAHGSPDDLKYMVDKLHERGIAVVLDVVWNHFSSSDNFLWFFDGTQVYYDNPNVNTPWGPQADFDRLPVRNYFLDSVEHVLGTFNMDGYRHDAAFEITGATQAVSGQQLIRAHNDLIDRRFADAHSMAEIYDNSAWNTSPSGMNFDGQYHEAYKNAILDAINAAAFGNPDLWRVANSLDGSGTWVEGTRVLNYFELHDDAWPLNQRARAPVDIDTSFPHDDRYATGRTKLGNGLTILSRGMPAILQGSEWLESNGWETQKIDWSKKNTYRGIFDFYRDLIALRTTEPALFADSFLNSFHVNDAINVMAFERSIGGGAAFVVLANFSNTDYASYAIGLPRAGRWEVELNSEDAAYLGRGVGPTAGCVAVSATPRDGFAQSASLALPAHGFLLLRHRPEGGTPPVITTQPSDASGCVGGSIQMVVESAAAGATYAWQFQVGLSPWLNVTNGTVAGVATFAGAGTNLLTITNPQSNSTLRFRATVAAGCDSTTSATATLTTGACDCIDFNRDGSLFDPQDIDAFLSVFAEGPCVPETATCNDIDFNNDGGLFDPCDIDSFLVSFGEGPCTACGQ
jgi:1,4-alpha-glucan branching enzyme